MKILIISKFFSPERSIAAVRWTKIAKYLKINHKYEIDVLTETRNFDIDGGLPIKIPKDVLLEKDLKWIDRNLEVPMGKFLFLLFSLRNRVQKKGEYTESLVILQNKNEGFTGKVKKCFINFIQYCIDYLWGRQAVKYLKKQDIADSWDVVISSCGPFWVHRAAHYIKRIKKDVLWIADFRDPFPSGLNNKLFFSLEEKDLNRYCSQADIILRINDTMRLNINTPTPLVSISNGYDPDERKEPKKPSVFSIIYTGSLYYYSLVSPLFKAINELIESGEVDEKDICVDFYGGRAKFIEDQVKAYCANRYYTHHGVVARDEIIAHQQKAAILLQMERNDDDFKAGWSGKMFEYMMSSKPIIYIVSGNASNSMPAQNMKKLGGYCYEQCRDDETYHGLKKYIKDKYNEWKHTGDVFIKQEKDFVESYSYSSIADSVSRIIDERKGAKQ